MTIVTLTGQNGKTFLELCQSLRQEVSGNGSGPSSVVGQAGELKRIVDWVARADRSIQQIHDEWKFLTNSFTINTVAGTGSYDVTDCAVPITDLKSWRHLSFKLYLQSSGVSSETKLDYIPYQQWWELYNTGSQTNSRPMHFTISDRLEIFLGPVPDDVYVLRGEYHRAVTTMTVDADTPVYPGEFHDLPMFLAMTYYGRYTGANEVYQDGMRLYSEMLHRMERTQKPRMEKGRPLA